MDVDIDHLGEFWMWICADFGAMDLEEWIYGGRCKNGWIYGRNWACLYPPHRAERPTEPRTRPHQAASIAA